MNNLLVIGKNSFYYNQLKSDLNKNFNVVEISHLEISNEVYRIDKQWDLILIFARTYNPDFFTLLNQNYKFKKIILISSIILNLPNKFKFYSYYKEKFNVEKWFTQIFNSNCIIIRSGTIESKTAYIYSKKFDFISLLSNLDNSPQIVSLPVYKSNFKIPPLFYSILFNLPYGYLLVRPLDFIYKKKVAMYMDMFTPFSFVYSKSSLVIKVLYMNFNLLNFYIKINEHFNFWV